MHTYHSYKDILRDTIKSLSAKYADEGKETFNIRLNHEEAKMICDALDRCQPCQTEGATIVDDTESQKQSSKEQMENFNPDIDLLSLLHKRREKARETMGISPYACTVNGMLSADYKERFKAEYQQTKIRYEKLKAFCNRIEAAMRTCPGGTKRVAMPEHDCPFDLLRDQQRAMGEYLHCLEIRAVIEGIDLT